MRGRHLDERLALAAPRVFLLVRRLLMRLPPGSSLRRRAIKRMAVRGWDAVGRADDDVALLVTATDYEITMIGAGSAALGNTTRGQSSGVELSMTVGSVYFLEDGVIVRQDFYWDWGECAAALGIDG